MTEATIYTDNHVTVTTARLMIQGTTYAMRNITSVKMARTPPDTGCATLFLFSGFMALIVGITLFNYGFWTGFSGIIFAVGIIVVATRWQKACKAFYHLIITSNSGETRAMTSQDKNHIWKIVQSINKAIVLNQ